MLLSAQKRQTFRRPMPRRRNPRPSPFPRRSPRSRSAILRDLLVQALELGGALELGLLALGPARGDGARRRRRRVLGLAHRHEAEHAVHELQVALDLEQPLRRAPVLEEDVERPPLLGEHVGELAQPPLLHLTDGPALVLDQLLHALGQLLRGRLPQVGMEQDERLIAAVRDAVPPVVLWDYPPALGPPSAAA